MDLATSAITTSILGTASIAYDALTNSNNSQKKSEDAINIKKVVTDFLTSWLKDIEGLQMSEI